MKQKKAMSLLGLAQKAGQIRSGEFGTEKAVRDGTAKLVIVAGDAAERTKKEIQNLCRFYQVDLMIYGEKDTLGHAIGKESRALLAILEAGLARGIKESIRNEDEVVVKGGHAYGKN